MRKSKDERSRSRSKESSQERKQRKRSSSPDQGSNENDNDDENSENRSTSQRNTRPSSRTTITPKSSSPSSSPLATTFQSSTSTTATAITSTTNNGRDGGTSRRMTTTVGRTMTTTATQPTQTSELTLTPSSPNSSNMVTITVLAVVAGLVSVIVVLLALFLAWRKWCQGRPPTEEEAHGNKSTYHMYSEIDHSMIILDEEPRGPSNHPATDVNDRAIPSAPPNVVLPDYPVNDNTYDKLHHKELVESSDAYSVLDPRLVDLNDPRLNTYDVMSNITGKSVITDDTSGTLEQGGHVTPPVSPTRELNKDINCNSNLHSETPDGGQYFLLEKLSGSTESTKPVVDRVDQKLSTEAESDNYFKLEPS